MRTTLAFLGTCLFAFWIAFDAVADTPLELFSQKCAGCHGMDGKGQTPMGRMLNIKDLSDPKQQAAAKDAKWQKVILDGIQTPEGRVLMPSFKDKLTPAEAKALVKVTRDLKAK